MYASTFDPATNPPYEMSTLPPGCTMPGAPSATDGVDSISSTFNCSAAGGVVTGDGAVVVGVAVTGEGDDAGGTVVVGDGVEGAAVVVVVGDGVEGAAVVEVVGDGVEGAAVVEVVDVVGTAAGFTTTISGSSVIEIVTEPSALASPSSETTPPTMA